MEVAGTSENMGNTCRTSKKDTKSYGRKALLALKRSFKYLHRKRGARAGHSSPRTSKSILTGRSEEQEIVAAGGVLTRTSEEQEIVTSEGTLTGSSPERKDVAAEGQESSRPESKQPFAELKEIAELLTFPNVVKNCQQLETSKVELQKLLKAIEAFLEEDSRTEERSATLEQVEQTEASERLAIKMETSGRIPLLQHTAASFASFFTAAGDGLKRTSDYVRNNFDPQKEIVKTAARTFGHMGQLHWAGLLLSGIAFVLNRWEQLKTNKQLLRKVLSTSLILGSMVVEIDTENSDGYYIAALKSAVVCIFSCIRETIQEIGKKSAVKLFSADLTKEMLEKYEMQMHQEVGKLTLAVVLNYDKKLTAWMNANSSAETPEYRMSISIDAEELDRIVPAIGMDGPLEKITEKLQISDSVQQDDKIRAVVIHGMAGIGKSTVGKRLYYHLIAGKHFDEDKACILDMSPPNTVEMLQDELLLKFQHKDYKPGTRNVIKQRLVHCFKKLERSVFIFVDNLEEGMSLKLLLPDQIVCRLPAGSRLLVASRNSGVKENVLEIGIDQVEVFEMRLLDRNWSKRLLRNLMLRNSSAELPRDFIQYEEQVLEVCDGLPLALEVIGSYLKGREAKKNAWENVINALNEALSPDGSSDDKLSRALKFSYNILDAVTQQAFLDIVFCFNQSSWSDVEILYPSKLDNLRDRALVKKEVKLFKHSGLRLECVKVHSCFVALGRKIAYNLGSHIRIDGSRKGWNFKEVPQVLVLEGGCRGGYQIVQAVDLDNKLGSLRILIMTDVKFKGNCEQLPHDLKCLYCHHSNVPFPLGNLENLTLVDISSAVDTEYEIPRGVRSLRLDAPSLEKLRIALGSQLKDLGLMFCPRVQLHIQQITCSCLKKLVIRHGTSIKTLPTHFTGLQAVSIQNCSSFQLPRDLSNLRDLRHLHISGARELADLPANFSRLENLTSLTLEDCPRLEKLPTDLGSSGTFQFLEVKGCPSLKSLPVTIHSWSQDEQDHRGNTSESRKGNVRGESRESSRWLLDPGNAEELKQEAIAAQYMIPLIHTRATFDRLSDLVYELYSEEDSDPDVEIVVLPGISKTLDNREAHWRTWRRKDTEECWMQTLLPESLKDRKIRARILTVSYESLLNNSVEAEEFLAKAMIRDLILHPESGVGQRHNVPVILVGHGLGGIVIKYFVRTVIEKLEGLEDEGTRDKLTKFRTNLKAFVFYSTPMLGSQAMEGVAASIQEDSPDEILRFLKVLNKDMVVLNEYITRVRKFYKIKIFALFELLPTNQGDYENKSVMVVHEASARNDVDASLAVQEDHYGIAQASNKYSFSVDFLAQKVEEIVQELRTVSTD